MAVHTLLGCPRTIQSICMDLVVAPASEKIRQQLAQEISTSGIVQGEKYCSWLKRDATCRYRDVL